MKKKDVLNLIRSHVENNEVAFRNAAYVIADDFRLNGDATLADYILALMSDVNAFVPQSVTDDSEFLEYVKVEKQSLFLPDSLHNDILGLIHAASYESGIRKILFYGAPGTGKTETVKNLARILHRELFSVNFSLLIDSRLGQTQKNVVQLFKTINSQKYMSNAIVLFDEIDALALDRTNARDLREMGRVTSTMLKELEAVNDKVIIIATTNLYEHFDRAFVRRFDAILNFDQYKIDDLIEISEKICNYYLLRDNRLGRNMRLLGKIVKNMSSVLSPAELKNSIKVAIAFSDKNDKFDYLRRLFTSIVGSNVKNYQELQDKGFSLREIEILSGDSKSKIGRELQ